MSFIDQYLHYTRVAESPTSFLYWTALGTLGSIMRDNVYLEPAYDKIFPNLYILCVARSGACRKGVPLKIASGLVRKIGNTKLIAGQASIPAVMLELGDINTDGLKSGLKDASGLLYSEELSAFLVEDAKNIPVLTDLYDYHADYEKSLVSTGKIRLKRVCLSLMAASNEPLLREVYTQQAVYGGLLARTILVLESKRRRKNSRMYENGEYDPKPLIDHLRILSQTKGKAEIDNKAKKLYDDWYNSIEDDDYDEEGVVSRIHTTVLKVALCLAASDSPKKIIVRISNMEEAITKCVELIPNYQILSMGVGTSDISISGKVFIRSLLSSPNQEITRSKFLRENWSNCPADSLDRIIETLTQGGSIKVKGGGRGGITYYLTEEGRKVFLETRKSVLERKKENDT